MKNPVLPITILILFFINISANGQSLKDKFSKDAIYLQMGFFSGQKYIKNGVSHRVGLFNRDLYKEMKPSKDAFKEYKKFTKNRNTGIILSVTGSFLVAGGFIYMLKDSRATNRRSIAIANSLIYAGLISSFVSIHFNLKSNNNLHKAVWLRNRDLLEL